jgi:HlyD family secretion protein
MLVRRSLIVLILITLSLPLCIFLTSAQQILAGQDTLQNLQLYTVESGTVQLLINGIGQVQAESVAEIAFTQAGRVAEVLVQSGDYVLAGDVLGRLDQESEQLAYDQAVLQLELANLQREDLLEPVDEDDIRIAQANLDSAWGAYLGIQNAVSPEDLQAAELRYQQAQQAYQDAIQERSEADGGQPEQAYQILDAQVGAASFNAEIARLQLQDIQNGNQGQLNASYARVVQAQRELERVQSGPTQQQLDQADIAIEQAQLGVDRSAQALVDRSVVAPFDGVISLVNVEVGSLGTPALAAFQLTDITPLHVTVQIDEVDIRNVRENIPASIELDALPDLAFPAVIERIALVGTSNNGIISYEVRLRLDVNDPRVREGMTAEASVVIEEVNQVLVVPNQYIRLDRQRDTAFVDIVNAEGRLEEVEIQLGLQGDETSEVISGLNAGTVLAVDLGGDALGIFGG